MSNEELIKAQRRFVVELQRKIDRCLTAGRPDEMKDIAIALQAAIDGLATLEAMNQANLASEESDRKFAEFQERHRKFKDQQP